MFTQKAQWETLTLFFQILKITKISSMFFAQNMFFGFVKKKKHFTKIDYIYLYTAKNVPIKTFINNIQKN